MHRIAASFSAVAVLALGFGLGCQTPGTEATTEPVASIGGVTIDAAELDTFIKDELFSRETRGGQAARVYDLRSTYLERLVAQRVVEGEAARRGVTPEELVRSQAEALGEVSDEEVASFYQANSGRLRGATLEQVAEPIRRHLEDERGRKAVQALVDAADVDILLKPPRVEVAADGPALGPEDAPVTIVEFSDFQCPYCRRASPVMREITARHPKDVRWVYRHLPLEEIHPRARASAEAAECAREQGQFWAYHDLLFANAGALEDADLHRYAEQLKLDLPRFEECVSSDRHADKVNADLAAAREVGITGTPAFVVNGILLFGYQDADAFEQIIRDELGEG